MLPTKYGIIWRKISAVTILRTNFYLQYLNIKVKENSIRKKEKHLGLRIRKKFLHSFLSISFSPYLFHLSFFSFFNFSLFLLIIFWKFIARRNTVYQMEHYISRFSVTKMFVLRGLLEVRISPTNMDTTTTNLHKIRHEYSLHHQRQQLPIS